MGMEIKLDLQQTPDLVNLLLLHRIGSCAAFHISGKK
jgi:hypothetical protein